MAEDFHPLGSRRPIIPLVPELQLLVVVTLH